MLTWKDGRWHCDGLPIHAGNCLQLRVRDGSWMDVRVESQNSGEDLFIYTTIQGESWRRAAKINREFDILRWPKD